MKYELVALEQVISTYFNNRTKDLDEQQQAFAITFEGEADRVANVFLGILFQPVSEAIRKRYIRHHQQRLQYLEEKIYRYKQSNEMWLKTSGAWDNYEKLQKSIERLLKIVETHFSTDMLMDSVAPASYNKRITDQILSEMYVVEQKLSTLKINSRLSEILLKSLEQFTERGSYHLSCYGQLHMIRQIVHQVLHHEPSAGLEKSSEQTRWMVEMLCSVNFNRLCFYSFCKEWIVQYFSEEKDKLYLYTRCGKFFSGLCVKEGVGWNLKRLTITEMLSDYFRDNFLSEKRTIQQSIMLNSISGGTKDKLLLNYTVEQLGLFIRLLAECNLMKSKSVSSAIRFFVQHVNTIGKGAEHEISYDYLKNSYNRPGLSAIESMDRYLHEMAGVLRKMKLEVRKNAPGKN